jgi:hypothetical protein
VSHVLVALGNDLGLALLVALGNDLGLLVVLGNDLGPHCSHRQQLWLPKLQPRCSWLKKKGQTYNVRHLHWLY